MLAWGGVAWAQSPTETPEGANSTTENASGQLEEVVVTAEKRTEDVQKIPIVVETASAEDLERSGALQLRDLERAIPDVIIAPQGPAVTLMIRGVFSTDTSPGSENADAINLDGAYLAKTQGMITRACKASSRSSAPARWPSLRPSPITGARARVRSA
jgi:iron complex outermembrane receptor protein